MYSLFCILEFYSFELHFVYLCLFSIVVQVECIQILGIDVSIKLLLKCPIVLVMSQWSHASSLMLVSITGPPYLDIMYLVSPLYIFPSHLVSFRVSLSCFPMHSTYAL